MGGILCFRIAGAVGINKKKEHIWSGPLTISPRAGEEGGGRLTKHLILPTQGERTSLDLLIYTFNIRHIGVQTQPGNQLSKKTKVFLCMHRMLLTHH